MDNSELETLKIDYQSTLTKLNEALENVSTYEKTIDDLVSKVNERTKQRAELKSKLTETQAKLDEANDE